MIRRERVGDILIRAGKITEEQLAHALEEQPKTHKRVGDVLVDLGFIAEDELADTLSAQLKIPRVRLEEHDPSREALDLLPIEFLQKNMVCPVKVADGRLELAVCDPLNIFLIDEIEHKTGLKVKTFIDSGSMIRRALEQANPNDEKVMERVALDLANEEAGETDDAMQAVDLQKVEGPIMALAHQIIEKGIAEKASDIHVEPAEASLRVRFRIDGVLQELIKIPPSIMKFQGELISRLKLMANIDISEKRLPQDGRIKVSLGNKKIDLRVNSLPVAKGEKICIRILGGGSGTKQTLEDLGFSKRSFKIFNELIRHPNGLVLVTGPTGSGKTSTLYAALDAVSNPGINICTVEDPIEYNISEFNQTQINPVINMSFGMALRALLRQDPDVILIGEIRDNETAKIAVESALTGHLVFSTLHTNSASATVARLTELEVEPYMVASVLLGVVAQRLCRRLCDRCKKEAPPSPELVDFLERHGKKSGRMFIPVGCKHCKESGYLGRQAIHEILVNSSHLREHVINRADAETIANTAKKHGFVNLLEDGYVKVLQGITSLEELLRVAR